DDEESHGKDRRRKPAPKYRLPPGDLVRSVARRQLGRMGLAARSQAGLRRAMLPSLATKDPLFVLGGWRLRKLLIDSPGIRVDVRYAERPTRRPLQRCPVCRSPLKPIRNRTLEGDRVTLGYQCTHCAYWTHLRRRVPVRYRYVRVNIDGEPLDSAE
ncbi:MAG: hypothetical protein WAN40_02740, partial [Thermoplasmata archaeon]